MYNYYVVKGTTIKTKRKKKGSHPLGSNGNYIYENYFLAY